MKNINTKQYWDERFKTGDWENKGGEDQTRNFALSQIKYFKIKRSFNGSILDFGCGLGDAIPIYHRKYPNAKLMGLDISEKAILKCKNKFEHIATFICGDYTNCPSSDIIIASNVFEHLSEDKIIAKHLLSLCKRLIIIVPYKERIDLVSEHVNSYTKNSFEMMGKYDYIIFPTRGWSQFGYDLYFHIYFKNIFRFIFRKSIKKRSMQIMFIFKNEKH